MAENTSIEWCDHTWSPVWGCTQVSKAETGGGGCDNCYAMELAHRFGTGWNGAPMREFGDAHWNNPVRWDRKAKESGTQPKVFPSMCDPLDKDWPDAVRERFWRLVDATPYLTWLILTKRIGNADRLGPGAVIGRWPANVWMGATIVNQTEANRDIPKLVAVPARKKFLSIEPMLGPIDLTATPAGDVLCRCEGCMQMTPDTRIDWVICGGESGRRARPMNPDWASSLRTQCNGAGVPFLFKQWGEWGDPDSIERTGLAPRGWFELSRDDGGVPRKSWTGPIVRGVEMASMRPEVFKVGKKPAGRLLDGRTHDEFPSSA